MVSSFGTFPDLANLFWVDHVILSVDDTCIACSGLCTKSCGLFVSLLMRLWLRRVFRLSPRSVSFCYPWLRLRSLLSFRLFPFMPGSLGAIWCCLIYLSLLRRLSRRLVLFLGLSWSSLSPLSWGSRSQRGFSVLCEPCIWNVFSLFFLHTVPPDLCHWTPCDFFWLTPVSGSVALARMTRSLISWLKLANCYNFFSHVYYEHYYFF